MSLLQFVLYVNISKSWYYRALITDYLWRNPLQAFYSLLFFTVFIYIRNSRSWFGCLRTVFSQDGVVLSKWWWKALIVILLSKINSKLYKDFIRCCSYQDFLGIFGKKNQKWYQFQWTYKLQCLVTALNVLISTWHHFNKLSSSYFPYVSGKSFRPMRHICLLCRVSSSFPSC